MNVDEQMPSGSTAFWTCIEFSVTWH